MVPGNAGIANTPVGLGVSTMLSVSNCVVITKDGGRGWEVAAHLQGCLRPPQRRDATHRPPGR
ncbi:hypothetical protein ASF73_15720 [Xanthomonas sp. Leaf131]|nr:hypothetical protein ASF73_15720 [Xanthomonas sp. Leaf131]